MESQEPSRSLHNWTDEQLHFILYQYKVNNVRNFTDLAALFKDEFWMGPTAAQQQPCTGEEIEKVYTEFISYGELGHRYAACNRGVFNPPPQGARYSRVQYQEPSRVLHNSPPAGGISMNSQTTTRGGLDGTGGSDPHTTEVSSNKSDGSRGFTQTLSIQNETQSQIMTTVPTSHFHLPGPPTTAVTHGSGNTTSERSNHLTQRSGDSPYGHVITRHRPDSSTTDPSQTNAALRNHFQNNHPPPHVSHQELQMQYQAPGPRLFNRQRNHTPFQSSPLAQNILDSDHTSPQIQPGRILSQHTSTEIRFGSPSPRYRVRSGFRWRFDVDNPCVDYLNHPHLRGRHSPDLPAAEPHLPGPPQHISAWLTQDNSSQEQTQQAGVLATPTTNHRSRYSPTAEFLAHQELAAAQGRQSVPHQVYRQFLANREDDTLSRHWCSQIPTNYMRRLDSQCTHTFDPFQGLCIQCGGIAVREPSSFNPGETR